MQATETKHSEAPTGDNLGIYTIVCDHRLGSDIIMLCTTSIDEAKALALELVNEKHSSAEPMRDDEISKVCIGGIKPGDTLKYKGKTYLVEITEITK